MFKNSKLLKGITIALAFVLVLGGGILLKLQADAAANTVVLYVSEDGDNTTGLDPASAFTSIADATAAANEMKLAPGTELRLIVVERVSVSTISIDVNEVKDSAGGDIHITITSYHDDDPANFSTISHCYVTTSPSSSNQRATVENDVTFKNIILSAEVQPFYVGNYGTPEEGGLDNDDLFRTRNLYIQGNDIVFDNCQITSSLGAGVDSWVLYGDSYSNSTAKGSASLSFLNGDYANITVYLQDHLVPYWDLSLYTENADMGTVYVLADTDTAETNNANTVKAYFKGGTIKSFRPTGRGNYGIPGGVEVTFDGTTVNGWTSSLSTAAILTGDLTYNFIGGAKMAASVYLAPQGALNGNLVANLNDCEFGTLYVGSEVATGIVNGNITTNATDGYASFFCGGGNGDVYGNVTNNIFVKEKFGQYVGGSGSKGGTIHGTITNNLDGDFKVVGNFYGASRRGTFGDVVNNVSGNVYFNTKSRHVYFGGGYDGYCVSGGTITNNISGGIFFKDVITLTKGDGTCNSVVSFGNYLGSCDAIVNNITGGDFYTTVYLGSYNAEYEEGNDISCGSITNNISGGSFNGYSAAEAKALGDTTGGAISFAYYGGPYVGSCGSITNNISGGLFYPRDSVYLGGGGKNYTQAEECAISGNVINNITGGTFSSSTFLGPKSGPMEGNIYSTITGGKFGTLIGGGIAVDVDEIHTTIKNAPDGSCASFTGSIYFAHRGRSSQAMPYCDVDRIYNNISGDATFSKTVFGGDGSQNNISINEAVVNNISGGTFSAIFYGGSRNNTIDATITNNISGDVTFKDKFIGGGMNGGTGAVTNNIYAGTFNGRYYGGSTIVTGEEYEFTAPSITNNIYDGASFGTMWIGAGQCTSTGTVTNNFYGGLMKYRLYGKADGGNYCQMDVINNVYGGTFNCDFIGGSANSQPGSITNNITGGHFVASHKDAWNYEAGRVSFHGGDWSATNSGTTTPSITNNISGGIFEHRVYLGGRIGTVGEIHSTISGGIFKGDRLSPSMYQDSASKKCTSVTLDIKPDDSANPLYFACNYTPYGDPTAPSSVAPSGTASDRLGKVQYSFGLENFETRPLDTVVLYGASKPIQIAGESFLNFDEVKGEVTFLQTENWVAGNVYVTLSEDADSDLIKFASANGDVAGFAAIDTQSVKVDSKTSISRLVLVGDDSTSAPAPAVAPTLAAINFVMDSNLEVNFYADKAAVEAYIASTGSFPYSVSFGGKALVTGTIEDIASAEIVDGYVKIRSGFGIPAFKYGDAITISFAGNVTEYSVYDLLEIGIAGAGNNTALADLLKAIYNYGVESEKLVGEPATDIYYDEITYTGTYTGSASAQTLVDGYKFAGTGLSLGEEVSLNFYLNAASTEGLTFSAKSAAGVLSQDRIKVIPFEGNSAYNVVISLRLDIASMDDEFVLTVSTSDGTELATCTNCIAYSCASYIATGSDYAAVSGALLAYVEKAQLA